MSDEIWKKACAPENIADAVDSGSGSVSGQTQINEQLQSLQDKLARLEVEKEMWKEKSCQLTDFRDQLRAENERLRKALMEVRDRIPHLTDTCAYDNQGGRPNIECPNCIADSALRLKMNLGPNGEIPVEAIPESRATGSNLAADSGVGSSPLPACSFDEWWQQCGRLNHYKRTPEELARLAWKLGAKSNENEHGSKS